MKSPHFQIPRNALVWLLFTQVLLLVPHLSHLPVWILVAWLAAVVWRVQIYRGLWSFPGRWVKGILVALCFTGLLSGYERVFSIDAMVGLLVTAFLLKLLEMHRKRDALIVILLGYFVAATQFLFSQSLLTAAYIALSVVVLTTALLSLHQTEGHRYPWRSFKLAGTLILQSIPLMVVLFIVMPRIGSLWAVPQPEQEARTGISDTIAPGDFSSLAQDNSTAFRVTFDGEIPHTRDLYWRGLVLPRFDGRRWSRSELDEQGWGVSWSRELPRFWEDNIELQGDALRYEIILEPTQQHWLFALPLPTRIDNGLGYTRDYRLVSRQPVRQRMQYEVESHLNYSLATRGLSDLERRQSLMLPTSYNPVTRRMAKEWFAQSANELDYINRVLNYFRDDFFYTLQPPLLGEHSIDEFLWESKRGFCEHYASAFAFMMRAVGIPARVVAGYQGGELNPVKNFLVVRQADAHAWTEVWLPGRGWLRVDPTAAVAPERIESGSRSLLSSPENAFLADPFSLDSYNWPFLQTLRLRLEALEYDWHRWIMNYDQERQQGFLGRLLGNNSPVRIAAFLILSACIVLGAIGLQLLLGGRQRSRDPGQRLYEQFLRRLKTMGIERQRGEGPRSLAARVEEEQPELAAWAAEITRCYERYAYGSESEALLELKDLVKRGPEKPAKMAS